jgi:hypothetical protein
MSPQLRELAARDVATQTRCLPRAYRGAALSGARRQRRAAALSMLPAQRHKMSSQRRACAIRRLMLPSPRCQAAMSVIAVAFVTITRAGMRARHAARHALSC